MENKDNQKKKQLLRKRAEIISEMPSLEEVLEGSLFKRRRRCGKASCRCAEGSGHLSWYLGIAPRPGHIKQTSLPADLVPKARCWVSNYRTVRKLLKKLSAINHKLIRLERAELKQAGNGHEKQ